LLLWSYFSSRLFIQALSEDVGKEANACALSFFFLTIMYKLQSTEDMVGDVHTQCREYVYVYSQNPSTVDRSPMVWEYYSLLFMFIDYVQRSSSSLYRILRYRNCLNYITL